MGEEQAEWSDISYHSLPNFGELAVPPLSCSDFGLFELFFFSLVLFFFSKVTEKASPLSPPLFELEGQVVVSERLSIALIHKFRYFPKTVSTSEANMTVISFSVVESKIRRVMAIIALGVTSSSALREGGR